MFIGGATSTLAQFEFALGCLSLLGSIWYDIQRQDMVYLLYCVAADVSVKKEQFSTFLRDVSFRAFLCIRGVPEHISHLKMLIYFRNCSHTDEICWPCRPKYYFKFCILQRAS
jgi:hypothetical protein